MINLKSNKSWLMVVWSLISACQHQINNGSEEEFFESGGPLDRDRKSLTILDDEGLPIKDVLEEGFCYDDIYATYLREAYLKSESPKLARFRSSRSRNQKKKSIENESLFFARSHLLGPLPPYYGAIPVVSNHEVEFWMRYFKTRGRNTFLKWLVRANSLRKTIEPLLKQEGIPSEFLYLAMVESGFNNSAYSRMRATGAWQFMKGTAQLYDLKINHWVDERRDPVKSTIAAARYLRHLYGIFGDWYLAMAAYNAGPGKIKSAIRRSKSRDFWDISKTKFIRNETKHYVPKVLAAIHLGSNLRKHGFEIKADENAETPTKAVAIERPVKIQEIAQKLNLPLKTIQQWNPELIRNITPPVKANEPYALRLPEWLINPFDSIRKHLSFIEVTDVLMHQVKKGDTLSHLAKIYKVSIAQIRALNPKIHAHSLRIGKQIAIPVPGISPGKPRA